jgi:lysophospholipase L1-like esterase
MKSNPVGCQILCFGDSNTWGYIPNDGLKSVYQRYPANQRYPGVLQDLLGNSYNIIADGVNNRTIKALDTRPGKGHRQGWEYLSQCLLAHDPLNIVIIFMGTNELKTQFGATPDQVAAEIIELAMIPLNFESQINASSPRVIVVAPPPINDGIAYANARFEDGSARSLELKNALKRQLISSPIQLVDCFDIEDIGSDGLHLLASGHRKLAESLYKTITKQ